MPAKKNRARYGINNSTAPSQTINLKPHIINNLTNGTNFNGYSSTNITNNNNNNHYNQHPSSQVKSTSYSIPSTAYSPTVNGTGVNVGTGTITFTAKQQQQLDRNAFLLMLTKDQLKVECRKRGQKTTGTKTELVFINNFESCFTSYCKQFFDLFPPVFFTISFVLVRLNQSLVCTV